MKALLVLAALCGVAGANGRPAGGRSIHFRNGHETDIVVGATFGLLVSHDGGASWQWMCELAAFYGGEYDPFYAWADGGALWATSNDKGLHASHDGCKFDPMLGKTSTIAMGADGAVYAGAAIVAMPPTDPGDSQIYVAADGATLVARSMPGRVGDWWQSFAVASPRVYLSGFRMEGARVQLLFASDDAGATWSTRPTSDFTLRPGSAIDLVGTAPGAPDVVYASVEQDHDAASEALYRSDDAGQTWKRLVGTDEPMSALVRANGDVVVATLRDGAQVSHDRGATWSPLVSPHVYCLAENSAGEVWACTQNHAIPGTPGDGYGLMKTTDLATWTPVLRFEDIVGPVACPAGTEQHDGCEPLWCGLVEYLGISTPAAEVCHVTPPADDVVPPPPPPRGCCRVTTDASELAPAALVGMVLVRRRRRTRCSRASIASPTARSTCRS